ncbi:MAG: AAA family ATPase [Desulfovibrio sp.]|nr:AAA family ATPase [Desulfovibrio sp.]
MTTKTIKFVIITGCFRIVKESIFSCFINFECFGVSGSQYVDKFGFFNNEVDMLLQETLLSCKKSLIQEWHDGYRFGCMSEIYYP